VTVETILFFIFAGGAIFTALLMIRHPNPVISAISLIGNFFCLAALYLLLRAQLLAALQIVIYTGAIMVLVIFVIMLLNLGDEQRLTERYDLRKVAGIAVAAGFLMQVAYIVVLAPSSERTAGLSAEASRVGTVEAMGDAMFGRFLLPFEAVSLLLLAAIVGAVVLAKRNS